jgi:hypothetical protein
VKSSGNTDQYGRHLGAFPGAQHQPVDSPRPPTPEERERQLARDLLELDRLVKTYPAEAAELVFSLIAHGVLSLRRPPQQ